MNGTRSCPICGGSDAKKRQVAKKGKTYEYAVCSSCGFLYLLEPEDDTISHGVGASNNVVHTRHRVSAELIKDWAGWHAAPPYRVGEIGAGTGPVGQLVKDDGNVAYVGYEPSESRCEVAHAHGVDVRCMFYNPAEQDAAADCFLFDNVLEHVLDPLELVQGCAQTLSDTGKMIIIVPGRYDLRRVFPKWRFRHYWQPHCHVNHFRRSDVAKMLHSAGLSSRGLTMREALKAADSMAWRIRFLMDRLGLGGFAIYLVGEKRPH